MSARPDPTSRPDVAPALFRRSLQLAGAAVLAGVGFAWEGLRGGPGLQSWQRALGRAAVAFCSRLGATFIKIGQIASTRSDLLPPALVAELATLQDRVPPFPFEILRSVLERELGAPPEAIFSELDPVPVAAASVAQVHRGRLREGGHEVAIKVRRPDIVAQAALDRSIMLFVARWLERLVPTLRLVSVEEAVSHFVDAVEEQLHLRNEARNNRRFRADFAEEADVGFPELHERWCTDAVLVMDFVEGVHERELAAAGVDVVRVVEAGMRAVCRMIFTHGFVHADLHPGNLRFLPPGRIVFLDLGLVGVLEDEDRVTTARLLFALATGDGPTVARLFYDNAPHAAVPDYARYEQDVCAFVESVRDKGLDHLQITVEIGRIFDLLRRHRVQARAHMTMVNVALMTAEGMGKRLAPDLSLTDEALPYLAEALGISPPEPRADRGA